MDGLGHGLVFILNVRALLIVAVPQEDGIVHRHGQLQHGGQRLGDVGNLAQEVVAAQVDHNADADAGQEDQRRQPAVQQDHHGQARAGHSQRYIDGLFLLTQILQIGHQRGHARDKALLAGQGADLADGVHGHVRRGGAVKKHRQHRCVSVVKLVIYLFRQDLQGHAQVGQAVIPDRRVHMLDRLNPFSQRRHILRGHILHHDQGESALAEIGKQFVLADDRIHVLGQIVQHIVVDAGIGHSQHGGNEKQQRDNQNKHAVFYNRLG